MTSFKRLHKVELERFKLIYWCFKKEKKYPNNFFVSFFLFLNEIIRNLFHGNIGLVIINVGYLKVFGDF